MSMQHFRYLAIVALGLSAGASAVGAALPAEIGITKATKLELLRDERVTGSIGLKPGDRLELLDVAGDHALVRFRNLNGRVMRAHTDLAGQDTGPADAAPAPAVAAAPAPLPAPAAPAAPRVAPPSRIERALAGKLVRMENGRLGSFAAERLAGVKFYALYFSASWCGPCRAFTPSLVDNYAKLRREFPEFEVVLMNADHSAREMQAYMKDDRMPWPALEWKAVSGSALRQYGGPGIPCLVLVSNDGRVLSDSFRGDNYVGCEPVVNDTWKILREYRKKNPRPKA